MSPSIVILAHPRSGSTTFRSIFECHELLSILNEPFNPTRESNGWGYDFRNHLAEHGSLNAILDVISANCNGTKHLLGQLDFEQDMEVFKHFSTRFLLCRRNMLRAVVSCKIADQTNQWHRRGKPRVANVPLNPIPLDDIQGFLESLSNNVYRTREVIEREKLDCNHVFYEDFFDHSIGLKERVEKCVALVKPFINGMFSKNYPHMIARQLDHGSNKVNSLDTYRLIPNCDEIHRNFSCDETGHLFNA